MVMVYWNSTSFIWAYFLKLYYLSGSFYGFASLNFLSWCRRKIEVDFSCFEVFLVFLRVLKKMMNLIETWKYQLRFPVIHRKFSTILSGLFTNNVLLLCNNFSLTPFLFLVNPNKFYTLHSFFEILSCNKTSFLNKPLLKLSHDWKFWSFLLRPVNNSTSTSFKTSRYTAIFTVNFG